MIKKGFKDNMSYLRTYYRFEEQGPLRKEHMESCFRAEDPKKFKEFLEWKEEMERIHPYGRDAILGKKAPPAPWEVKLVPREDVSFLKKLYIRIKEEIQFRFGRDYFT